ncbi:MAG: hypothetical protein PWP23_2384 [Candidatus Sumerlaeota bacterium]|nr:hypothetical protein [Candidatus Sumerlaeota bacterium]
MKKVFSFVSMLAIAGAVSAGTPTIDGTFDGVGVWGTAIATDASADGWGGADATNLYVTQDATYLYLGAECVNSDWMSFGFTINTTTGGGNTEDPWAYRVNFNYPDAPDFVLRGNNDNGWRELRTWNGSDWSTGSGVDLGATESNVSATFIECRIPLATLGIAGLQNINVGFFLTGNNSAEHGCFDQIPSGTGDTTADNWNEAGTSNVLNEATAALVPVELDSFMID